MSTDFIIILNENWVVLNKKNFTRLIFFSNFLIKLIILVQGKFTFNMDRANIKNYLPPGSYSFIQIFPDKIWIEFFEKSG